MTETAVARPWAEASAAVVMVMNSVMNGMRSIMISSQSNVRSVRKTAQGGELSSRRSTSISSSFSQRATTTAATPLPTKFVSDLRFGHEPIDAEDQRQARHRDRRHHGERSGERDESRAGDSRCSLGRQHRHTDNRQLLAHRQLDVERLCDEQRRHRQVDIGAVEVERIAGRHDQADHRLRTTQALELLHQRHERRLRRRSAEHRQQLLFDVRDEAENAEAGDRRDRAEHHEDEQQARQVEAAHQERQRPAVPRRRSGRW